ncbi:MAG: PadR family transcriptional regulator, partial [Crenarchaeota archaeon]|nr:PadR family transcriptional regulator [Thermoproteota archaeon]
EMLIGEKPSTGSVYPLLKSMQEQGWIVGEKVNNKTFYSITECGKDIVERHDVLKEHIFQKVRESVVLAHNTFDDIASILSTDFHLTFMTNLDILGPLINEISDLLVSGVNPEEIKKIISKTISDLKKLK